MNAKYYPSLRLASEYAQIIINKHPELHMVKVSKPSDILVTVCNAIIDIFNNDNKDFALKIAKVIFYGYYIEVNRHYNLSNGGN